MNNYHWQIGGLSGDLQAEDMRTALFESLRAFVDLDVSAITDGLTSLQVVIQDPAYTRVVETHQQVRTPEFLIWNHQCKGNAFIQALCERGYRRGGNLHVYRKVDFILTDHAHVRSSRIGHLMDFALSGVDKFFIYPHTARPNLVSDIVPEYDGITAQFVSAPGHVDVLRSYGYDKPLHVVGWSLCPIREFKPRREPRHVLFAPIHPRCEEIDQDANRAAFERLVKLAWSDDILLTVRHIYELERSGLEYVQHPNVQYEDGQLEPDYSSIDRADVVVSHQTFAWLAVARGVPTVMMAEDMVSHLVPMNQPPIFAKNWRKYQHLIAFPYDILAVQKYRTLDLLRRAVKSDDEIQDWKRRMIGAPFDPDAFVNALEGYL